MKVWHWLGLSLGAAAGLWGLWRHPAEPPRATGPLPHAAYVWQRVWTEEVKSSVQEHGADFDLLVCLAGEVRWQTHKPVPVPVLLDLEFLAQLRRPVGLALRIPGYAGPFAAEHESTRGLVAMARQIVCRAASNQIEVAELQLDFDCPESKLDGYRIWVESIQREIVPVSLVVTALPSWLNRSACRRLFEVADGFVLQVHSVERPSSPDAPFTLCDPAAATRAVNRAARYRRPFRVALPTYGYSFAFDASGAWLGLSAEGPLPDWPAGSRSREVGADATALAGLVAGWQTNRPRCMTGVIWYRLPVDGDQLNWAWPALRRVMTGEIPRAVVKAEVRTDATGLSRIVVRNEGDADAQGPVRLALRWKDGAFVAGDGQSGFALSDVRRQAAMLISVGEGFRLRPGGELPAGWLRLDQNVPIELTLDGVDPKQVGEGSTQ